MDGPIWDNGYCNDARATHTAAVGVTRGRHREHKIITVPMKSAMTESAYAMTVGAPMHTEQSAAAVGMYLGAEGEWESTQVPMKLVMTVGAPKHMAPSTGCH